MNVTFRHVHKKTLGPENKHYVVRYSTTHSSVYLNNSMHSPSGPGVLLEFNLIMPLPSFEPMIGLFKLRIEGPGIDAIKF